MQQAKQAIKNFLVRVQHVFTRVEAAVKTAAVTVIGGGVSAAADAAKLAHAGGHFTANLEGILALKASFITGAVLAFFTYLSQFPAFHPKDQEAPKN